MGNKEDEEFYRKIQILSRKELQGLCRIYGLPSDTSVDDLVKLMLSSLERKSVSSISSGDKSSGTKELPLPASSTPQLQRGTQLKSRVEAGKVSCGIIVSRPREEDNNEKYSQTGCKELGICMVAETCTKASGKEISEGFGSSRNTLQETSHSQIVTLRDESGFNSKKDSPKMRSGKNCFDHAREGGAGDFPPIQHRDINIGASSGESASASSTKAPSSLFEYHVRSDEGINLYVDLNSGSSYWTNRLKNEVYVCRHESNQRFQGIHQDLGQRLVASARHDKNLSLWNKLSGCGANDGHVETGSLPSSNLRENGLMEDTPGVDDGSFRSGEVQACSIAVETLGSPEEDQAILLSSRPSSDVQNHMISGTKTCSEDGETTTLNSSVCSFSKVKSTSNSVANSTSDGPKSFNAGEHQNSKLCTEICENSTLQNTSNIVNPSVASGSVEMRLSEDVNHCTSASFSPCGNGGVLHLVNPMHKAETEHGGLANSNVPNQETCRKHLASGAEEREGGTNLAKGTNSIETLQFGNSLDKTCLKSDSSDSIEGLHRKRKHNDGEFHSSTEHLSGEVLPRRSTRLVSK
ncbi:hypothetical protein VitviT2T_007438 [Vitis vinifera]|uniref:Uncharacterized protein n=1 Tax=Vitis vinifera TaxID=29760 RepID=A0ABY9BYS8_VITVI|nr:uncharacterized protein LOC100261223 isoform X1 [Vitis vinifera]XP_059593118.1 uncharacterized protein LOC100261223 isoform X1 [Vitis vinifera]XP_059593119.1 uncharacterized protein LOC100261223 isoform X1 [Vitis vinifera]XP_059593120.1 uncharacterized protein LOC100261223 isoform X1 [Vitis vinifera]XP_059593121.1 uncharacterized protein LOC100261223 isoform X1 [Vitis vinifera]XP_059593122.1 uncharacterized protein LOC100261223 isoform X1 [Vitis vinifera]XP_059593123.1 uncharacterized prot